MRFRVIGINTGVTSGEFTSGSNDPKAYMGNDLSSDAYLQINSCGIFEKLVGASHTLRPDGRRDHQILFVENGEVSVQTPDGELLLSMGDMIMIAPHMRHDYSYLPGCDAMWIHFTGHGAVELLKRYDIRPFVRYRISDTRHFRILAEKIIREYQMRQTGFEDISCAYLVQILTMAKRRIDAAADERPVGPPDLSPALEDMQTEFAKKREIADYAKMCCISSSYFISRFKKEYGMSPYRYLTEIRVSQAKHLLLETGISISEISHSIGYSDPFCFSRIFHKYTGMSPSEFRNAGCDKEL